MSFQEFVFPMRDALIERIVGHFEDKKLPWTSLTPQNVDAAIPKFEDRQLKGVYLLGLLVDGEIELKYVGQSKQAVYKRLRRHADFVQDRCGLPSGSVFFKSLGVLIFDSVALESELIKHYGQQVWWRKNNPLCGWNKGGLGSNDTGGGRDDQKPSGFDRRYPIDITLPKQHLLDPGTTTAKLLFEQARGRLPYTVRLPDELSNHTDLAGTAINVGQNIKEISLRQTIEMLLNVLPASWTVWVYPGRVVLAHDKPNPEGALVNVAEWPPKAWQDFSRKKCPVVVFRSQEAGDR